MDKRVRHAIATLVVLLVVLPLGGIWLGSLMGPLDIHSDHRFEPPSTDALAGRDHLGRDLAARTLYGAGLSIWASVLSISIAFVIAFLLGGIAGFFPGRWPDKLISYASSLLFTVPFFLIAVAVAAVVEPGIFGIFTIIGCVIWAPAARLARAEVIRLRYSRFTIAERAFGVPEHVILFRSLLPMAVVPPLVSLVFLLPELLGIDVGLSFFGLGVQPPTPSLGRLVFRGVSDFQSGWWLGVVPTALLLIVCLTAYSAMRRLVSPQRLS